MLELPSSHAILATARPSCFICSVRLDIAYLCTKFDSSSLNLSLGMDGGVQNLKKVKRLSCGVICVILRLAVLIQYRNVTDSHTDRQTDTRQWHIPRLA